MTTPIFILTILGQLFVPKFGGGTTPPPANGLLNGIVWYVEADQSSGDETPETLGVVCCGGNVFQEFNGSWGSTTGVITNSRTAGSATSFSLPYDYSAGGDFTVAGWFNLNNLATDQVLVSSWDISVPNELAREFRLRYITATGSLQLDVGHQTGTAPVVVTSVSIMPPEGITTGTWFFVAAGFNDTGNIIFITAKVRGDTLPAVTTAAFVGTRQNVSLGANLGADYDNGVPSTGATCISSGSALDGWGYWNADLGATKLDALYAETPYGSFTF